MWLRVEPKKELSCAECGANDCIVRKVVDTVAATARALELNVKPDYEKRCALKSAEIFNGEWRSHAPLGDLYRSPH